ncbi:hypothetical protein BGZ93_003060 [Podila epicladia]|nr:hypothetical protein BGZ92_001426 [Podila epicladia]KAG0097283.1 hypothetical protein BGZ93_003060 [Podila epicladia]
MFGSASQDYKFTFTAVELPESNVQKALQIPEILDMICNAVSKVRNSSENKTYRLLDEAEKAIRQLRLVSRAFRRAANTYFAVEIDSIECYSHYSRYWAKPAKKIAEKIVACGPYIHMINLDDDNKEALVAIADHCTNVRQVSLVFQEMPGCSVSQGDYSGVLAKWASLPQKKLETVNAVMTLEGADGKAVFKDFDSVRQYFRDIKTLSIQCSSPNEHHTVETRDRCYTPIRWVRFLSFLTYFNCLESLVFTGFFIDWKAMPARVLDPFSLEPLTIRNLTSLDVGRRDLEVSVVFRLNRLLPCLKELTLGQIKSQNLEEEIWESTYEDTSDDPDDNDDSDDDSDDDSEEDESEDDEDDQDMASGKNSGNQDGKSTSTTDVLLEPPALDSAPIPDKSSSTEASPPKVLPVFDFNSSVHVKSTLSFDWLWVNSAHVADLAELNKWAPKLKMLTCIDTRFFGDPSKDKADRMTALEPMNDRSWDLLDLRRLGKWRKRELDEYLQEEIEVVKVENSST